MRTLQLLRHDVYIVQFHCPIKAQIMAGDSHQIREFCYSYD